MSLAAPPLPSGVRSYLDAIVRRSEEAGIPLTSVVLFGSAATGGFARPVSDVDLLLVLADGAPQEARDRLRREVDRLEVEHGFRDPADLPRGAVEAFARRVTANVRSFFVCNRGDLLSGNAARILDIPRGQALFVDRVVVPSIVGSAVTAWGEDLLPHVPLPPIRRLDVLKALYAFSNQLLLSAAMFPLVPAATKYAMAALKRSVHNCYFCYHLRPAPLEAELEFFQARLGHDRALAELAELRREYRRALGFVLRCLPTVARLHLRTALDNRFPRLPAPRG
jgi:predicted nucleotidyltransferase